jgi:hypothetical protein
VIPEKSGRQTQLKFEGDAMYVIMFSGDAVVVSHLPPFLQGYELQALTIFSQYFPVNPG